MRKPRFAPPQDYGPLFTPEQIAAIRKARNRRTEQDQGEQQAPGGTAGVTEINRNGYKAHR